MDDVFGEALNATRREVKESFEGEDKLDGSVGVSPWSAAFSGGQSEP